MTVTLSGVPIYDTTNPQYNSVSRQVAAGDAVSVVGTASQTMKPNLFYNKFFCGLGSIPLPKLHSIDSAVATYEGFSIRVHKYADGDANVQKMRFDLLPAYVCFNPHMGGQFFGNLLDFPENITVSLAEVLGNFSGCGNDLSVFGLHHFSEVEGWNN